MTLNETILNKKAIAIIEDDRRISNLLNMHLGDQGCVIMQSFNGVTGLNDVIKNKPDLVILDVMLPGMNGFDLCKELRKREIYVPILMLTAKNDEIDKILGLEYGADDYMTKPFSIREMMTRIKAILRRCQINDHNVSSKKVLRHGELTIDSEMKKVTLNGQRIQLTKLEYKLLFLFASHPGRSYDVRNLLDLVWGYEHSGNEHTVTAHINRLRNKIEKDPSNPEYIITTWGLGYRFNDQIFSGVE